MPRIKSLDLARGFTVLCIPAVHTILLYSQPSVRDTLPGQLLRFIAEGPGAPLFMLLMGISVALQREQPFQKILKKTVLLLAAGYGLNILKFLLPYAFGWLPADLLSELEVPANGGAWTLVGLGDILQFAAPALLISYGITRFRSYGCIAAALAISIAWMSPLVWDAHSPHPFINYLLQLATGQPPRTFFPLFPWLAYPLVGLAIGRTIRRDGKFHAAWVGQWGLFFLILHAIFQLAYPTMTATSFYRTYPMDTTEHLGVVMITLYIWDVLSRYVKGNVLFRILTYCSRNITQIYLIQWPLICWGLPLFGYQQLKELTTLFVTIGMTILTLVISLSISSLRPEGIVAD